MVSCSKHIFSRHSPCSLLQEKCKKYIQTHIWKVYDGNGLLHPVSTRNGLEFSFIHYATSKQSQRNVSCVNNEYAIEIWEFSTAFIAGAAQKIIGRKGLFIIIIINSEYWFRAKLWGRAEADVFRHSECQLSWCMHHAHITLCIVWHQIDYCDKSDKLLTKWVCEFSEIATTMEQCSHTRASKLMIMTIVLCASK